MLVKRCVLCLMSLLVLTACRQEPMIQLSDKNKEVVQQKIDNKTKQGHVSQDIPLPEDAEESEDAPIEDVRDTWEEADKDSLYDFDNYTLYQPYQMKIFACGSDTYTSYMTYEDKDTQTIQMQERYNEGKTVTTLYTLGANAYEEIYQSAKINPYDNIIGTSLISSQGESKTLLVPPIEVDTRFEYAPNISSTITKLYEEAHIEAGTYKEVIEVLTELPQGEIRLDYYAPEIGRIAYWQGDKDGSGEWWELVESYDDVVLIHPMEVYQPAANNKLEKVETDFVWETNGSLATAFQDLFRDIKLLDKTIEINDIYVSSDNVAVVDFTPGVVAVLNQGEYSEETAIQAIVNTMADFFEVTSVRLTVSGNNMLPNSTPYPEGGIYQPLE